MWHNLFVPDLSVAEKIVRPVLVYVFLVIAVRLAGRRELAQLNSFDLVVLMMLANTVQNATIGNDNSMVGGLIGVSALLLVNYLVVRLFYRYPRIDRLVEGSPTELIREGRVLSGALAHEAITEEELMEAIRKQGLGTVAEVDRAVLETGGAISIVAHKPTPIEERLRFVERTLDAIREELAQVHRLVQSGGRATS
ncbi:MAG TPA: YetF domain-containing protein [bacterium]|nr:YetF domain-containing protein [bacterium]